MTNTDLLRSIIERSGFRLAFLAEKLGLSRYSLQKKIYNQSDFKACEIKVLCDVLSIDAETAKLVFFT